VAIRGQVTGRARPTAMPDQQGGAVVGDLCQVIPERELP
jgi:hypothetical protein